MTVLHHVGVGRSSGTGLWNKQLRTEDLRVKEYLPSLKPVTLTFALLVMFAISGVTFIQPLNISLTEIGLKEGMRFG